MSAARKWRVSRVKSLSQHVSCFIHWWLHHLKAMLIKRVNKKEKQISTVCSFFLSVSPIPVSFSLSEYQPVNTCVAQVWLGEFSFWVFHFQKNPMKQHWKDQHEKEESEKRLWARSVFMQLLHLPSAWCWHDQLRRKTSFQRTTVSIFRSCLGVARPIFITFPKTLESSLKWKQSCEDNTPRNNCEWIFSTFNKASVLTVAWTAGSKSASFRRSKLS